MIDGAAEAGDPEQYVRDMLDRGERIMGFGHRVYRAEDPRARVLRRTAEELGSPRVEVAEAFERAAIAALREKHPDRPLETNVEFWGAVVLEIARIPAAITPARHVLALSRMITRRSAPTPRAPASAAHRGAVPLELRVGPLAH